MGDYYVGDVPRCSICSLLQVVAKLSRTFFAPCMHTRPRGHTHTCGSCHTCKLDSLCRARGIMQAVRKSEVSARTTL